MPDKSIDMVLSDLPYGVLELKWDKKLPLDKYFKQVNRIIKDHGAIVLTASIKFATELIHANKKIFRYDLVWEKSMSVGYLNCNKMPMRSHELILVFYKHLPTYNPQGLQAVERPKNIRKSFSDKEYVYRPSGLDNPYVQKHTGYPRSILKFSNGNNNSVHPTQKPVPLFSYLIKTYTNEGGIVLDTCIGSGTTAVACIETNRKFIGFETERKYYDIANERIKEALSQYRIQSVH